MALLQIENLTFSHSDSKPIIQNLNLTISEGDFHVIFGPSGSGKSTLLNNLIRAEKPVGHLHGEVRLRNKSISQYSIRQQVSEIGFVRQNPHKQIIFEDVLQELAFGLENIGVPQDEMQIRIGEIVQFFGMQNWLHEKTDHLSGGQKQLLNLASTLVMNPTIIVLDEPTAQLDPIAAKGFIQLLQRINEELGKTIIIVEHRLESLFPIATHMTLIEAGMQVCSGTVEEIIHFLQKNNHHFRKCLPPSLQLATDLGWQEFPLTIKEGIKILRSKNIGKLECESKAMNRKSPVRLEVKNIHFRYSKNAIDLLEDVSFELHKGEIISIFGNNGSGKSTLLKAISGQRNFYKGSILIDGVKQKKLSARHLNRVGIASLPQDPSTLFIEDTIEKDFLKYCDACAISKDNVERVISLLQIESIRKQHPDDLSGGELQKAALAKLLLNNPQILLLDEPTKGLDLFAKENYRQLLNELKNNGMSILIVTHDLEFAARTSDGCTLFFDHKLVAIKSPQQFFKQNNFYTPTVNQLAKPFFDDVVIYEDLLSRIQDEMGVQLNDNSK